MTKKYKKIKSIFFVKNLIYYYINEATQFKLVKYNKSLQKLIDLNLNSYKLFSGKYIIYSADGKGKEYSRYNDNIFYEGGYSNGKRNGDGKEYNDKGELVFEGEYLNGKKWNGYYYTLKGGKNFNQ